MKHDYRSSIQFPLLRWFYGLLAMILISSALGPARIAYAASITVTTTADTIDAAGTCPAVTLAALPGPVVVLMITGGLIYTSGVAFYLWKTLPFHRTIWHVFVLAATAVFYAAVVVQVVIG